MDVRKEANFCQKVKIPILGVVENMSGFMCPHCSHCSEIFPSTTGGAEKMCLEMGCKLLGKLPLDPKLALSCDNGENYFENYPDSPITREYMKIVQSLAE